MSVAASPLSKPVQSEEQVDSSGWSASLYNKTAKFVYSTPFVAPILELLDAKPGESILDVGCGSGEVSLEIEKIVAKEAGGVVVGLDASESMVRSCASRSPSKNETDSGVAFQIAKAKQNGIQHAFVCDAHDIQVPSDITEAVQGGEGRFDAVFSNAALHWCKRDPLAVLKSAKRWLKPGGRLVVEMGGFMNPYPLGVRSALYAAIRARGHDPVAYDPWYFPSVEDYTKLLTAAGFDPTHISLTPRVTPLPNGLYEWLRLFVRNSFLKVFDEDEAREVMEEVVEKCRVDCQDAEGNWCMVYMRLRVRAVVKDP